VEAIFGVPAGQYDWAESDPLLIERRFLTSARNQGQLKQGAQLAELELFYAFDAFALGSRSQAWVSRHGTFTVGFDQEGRVMTTMGSGSKVAPPWKRWWKAIWK
jgi:hypothetical protein